MADKLIIVESPAKARTISTYLDSSYEVLASVGHVRDLATSGPGGLGLDIENDFKPDYRIIRGKNKIINELKKAAKDKKVFLATDPDREGEAIAWHIADELGLDLNEENRIVFSEITKDAVLEAINNPRKLDMNLVNSQEVRRAIDRIIGFKLSKLLQSKIKSKSAGRVQSVALKLIVDLEKEIRAFIPEEYFEIDAIFKDFKASYIIKAKERLNKEQADKIVKESTNPFIIDKVEVRDSSRKPQPPFTTSTLQQDAITYLGMSGSRAMAIAQRLYEGIDIDGEAVGLITYMRTDSTRMSNQFVGASINYIKETYGDKYLGPYKTTKTANQQDAHEAIRPTSVYNTPEKMEKYLDSAQYRIYKRIYERAVASLMSNAIFERTKVVLNANSNLYEVSGVREKFDGFLKVYEAGQTKDVILPEIKEGDQLNASLVEAIRKETQLKPRYNEASLIKDMEKLGIGRPSTYAHTMETLKAKNRDYTTLDKKRFHATDHGILTSDQLTEFFEAVINVNYTKAMEESLDNIANGEVGDVNLLSNFYNKFIPLLDNADKNMIKIGPKKIDEACPECGHDLVERLGVNGKFIGCSNFPKCKYTRSLEEEVAK